MRFLVLSLVLIVVYLLTGCEDQEQESQNECMTSEFEPCSAAEEGETRCEDDRLYLCRNGEWNDLYNCAWNGGTCEYPEDGGPAACIEPE